MSRIKADLERMNRSLIPAERMGSLRQLEDCLQVAGWLLEETRTGRVRKRAKTLEDVVDIDAYRAKYLQLPDSD